MKQRQIPWVSGCLLQKRSKAIANVLVLLSVFLLMGGCNPFPLFDRTTKVYGKVTDQAGQPVDSVTILLGGTIGVSAGFPIKETLTDANGAYELVVDVSRKYHSAGIRPSLRIESLRSKYSSENMLIYKNGIETRTCCSVTIGKSNKYDFILLPK
jgi:hypothetical protein